jgi:holo-[acyl-carrier protein] synthase
MIVGVGSDLCNIDRIQNSIDRFGDRFLNRVFTEAERAKAERRPHTVAGTLAKRFAAKEAFSKAIGMGMRMPMTWRAMEVVKAPSGKPEIALHGELAEWFAARSLRAHVTVSDEQDYAVAFVVVETAVP